MKELLLRVALEYLKFGLSVIPIDGKEALIPWKEYQSRLPTENEVRSWFEICEPTGIAVITGRVSGVFVLDVDSESEDYDFEKAYGFKTVKAKSGKGCHYYFKIPEGREIQSRNLRPRLEADVKAEGGYVVMPPSAHISGKKYEWIVPFDRSKLSEPTEFFEEAGILKDTNSKPIIPLGQSEFIKLLNGVPEGNRHITATRIVGKLLADLKRQSWEMIPTFLLDWNQKNLPPMEFKELQTIFNSLVAKEKAKNPQNQRQKRVLTIKEVLESVDEKGLFLVDQLIPKNGITAMSGHPSSGKSWITLHLAECVATGKPLFETFPVEQGAVLIVDEESGPSEYKRRWKALETEGNLPIFLSSQEGYKLDNEDDLEHLKELIVSNNIKLLILDPFVAMHSKTENSADEMQSVMNSLQELAKTGASVLYVHHHRKDNGYSKGNRSQSVRGSSALSGRNDSHLAIEKKEENDNELVMEVFHEKSRRGKSAKAFSVKLVEKEPEKVEIRYNGTVSEEKIKRERVKDVIMEILEDNERSRKELIGMSTTQAKVGERTTIEAIKGLLKSGLINQRSEGKEVVYKLSDDVQSLIQ